MKPILFNTEMVRAIQDSTKTVTRRVMKPQPRAIYYDGKVYDDDGLYVVAENQNGGVEQIELPYRPGDILYVRETWQKNPYGIGWPYFYKASPEQFDHAPDKWHPSIHMPREAARIFLRVKSVLVERLQECGKGWRLDIEKEGIVTPQDPILYINDDAFHEALREEFQKVWDSTIKPAERALYGWEANPWVWVIEFDRTNKKE